MKKKMCVVLTLVLLFCVCALCACHEHEYGEWTVTTEPTCTQVGQKTRICECGEKETELIAATGHTEGNWVTDSEPTCAAQGCKHQVCATCGAVLKIQPLDATGHSFTQNVVEPTCTDRGYTTHTCACGYSYVDTYIDATGHNVGEWTVTTEPTCTQVGQKTRICECGEKETELIAATGHNFGEWTVITQPTCTQQGEKQRTCACGAVEKENIATVAHTFENWVVVRDSTCTEFGFELGFCTCGAVQKRTLDSLGHVDGEWTTDSEPTCTEAGSKHQVCSVCGATIKTEAIQATGHTYTETVVAPTCTTQGYTLHACHCGDSYKDTYVATNGVHNFQNSDNCQYCNLAIADTAVESYNMSATSEDSVRGYVVARADDNYDVYVKGSGNMKDYSYSNSPFYADGYSSKIVNAYIANTVTNIGSCAFYYCNFKNISIPSSVTSIGSSAFYFCSSLTSIEIPDNVTSIGDFAFSQCYKLTNIIIEGTPQIGAEAFAHTAYYNNANNWQNKVLYIGNCLIEAKTTIETCSIKEGTTIIANRAFCNCNSLTSIVIPSSVTSIGDQAFHNCSSLTSIEIPSSVTSIRYAAFNGCSSLKEMTIPFVGAKAGVTSSDTYQYPFGYIFGTSSYTGGTETEQYYYGSSTTDITCSYYYIPSSLKSVTVTGGNILYGAFYKCSNIASITIGDDVTSIGSCPFYYCTNLTSIEIPTSVTSIDKYTFDGCSSLTIYCEAESKPSGWNSSWNYSSCPVVWDCNNNNVADDGNIYAVIDGIRYALKDGVATVARQPSNVVSATIPSSVTWKEISYSVTSIGSSAFSGCSSLTSIEIPSSVTSIGEDAFYKCSSLTAVHITDVAAWCNIEFGTASSNPLGYAHNLYLNGELVTELEIPSTVTEIKNYAFRGCSSLTNVTFGENSQLESIGEWAFRSCSSLTSIEIPASVTSIGDRAFEYCRSLTSIVISSSVTSIGNCTFNKCSSLTSVTFEDPDGWYCTQTENATSGTALTLTDASQNATYLKSYYSEYYWYKND